MREWKKSNFIKDNRRNLFRYSIAGSEQSFVRYIDPHRNIGGRSAGTIARGE